MHRIIPIAALAALALVGCERTPQPIAQTPPLKPQPLAVVSATPDSSASHADSVGSRTATDTSTRKSNEEKSASARNPEPRLPIYYRNLCPGEGCQFGEWLTCDTLRVLSDQNENAKTAFVLHRGDRFTAVTGDEIVTQAGMVVFTRDVKIDEEGIKLEFTPADTLYPLAYTGEGFGTWYFRGKEDESVWFFGNMEPIEGYGHDSKDGYRVVRPSDTEWWVKVRAKDSREGWTIPGGSIYGMAPHYEPVPATCPPDKPR